MEAPKQLRKNSYYDLKDKEYNQQLLKSLRDKVFVNCLHFIHFRTDTMYRFRRDCEEDFIYNFLEDKEEYKLLFVFKLRHLTPSKIIEFLSYQCKQQDFSVYPNDYKDFLSSILIEADYMLSKKSKKITNFYIENSYKYEKNNYVYNKQEEAIDKIQEETVNEIQTEPLPEGYIQIEGSLESEKVAHFFTFLMKESNGEKSAFLTEKGYHKLLKYGFSVPNKPRRPLLNLKLERHTNKTKKLICYAIYKLYDANRNTKKTNPKQDYAKFLINNFEDFAELSVVDVSRRINNDRPKKMYFHIEKYLPK